MANFLRHVSHLKDDFLKKSKANFGKEISKKLQPQEIVALIIVDASVIDLSPPVRKNQ